MRDIPMVSVQKELLKDFIEEVKPLAMECLKEISNLGLPANPNYEAYLQMEEIGILLCITARDRGVLVGYALYSVLKHPHHGEIIGMGDSLYLHPYYRNSRAAAMILNEAENQLTALGAVAVIINMKVKAPFDGLALMLGYESLERIYGKRLSKK
jgi:hypothetical protein